MQAAPPPPYLNSTRTTHINMRDELSAARRQLIAMGAEPNGSRPMRYKSSLETLRWAGAAECIRDTALSCGLEITSLATVGAGLLRSRAEYELAGTERQIFDFIQSLSRSLRNYHG